MAQFTPEQRQGWARWTLIAFNKAANAVRGQYPVYIEGDERTTALLRNFAEVRLDGPDITEPSKGCFFLDVNFNLLINSKVDTEDLYAIERVIGQFQKAFTNVIAVAKLGDDPIDDLTHLGCYMLQSEIEINKFGIVQDGIRLMQSTIEARYRMTL